MPTAEINDTAVKVAHVGRQLRIGQDEYNALTKAAPRGQQNGYIIKALRSQLHRDGFLAKNGTASRSTTARRTTKRASKKR